MAIMLDGTQLVSTTAKPASTKVTYKPPTQTQYNTSYNEAQRRAQQYQAEMQRRQQEAARQAQQQQQAQNAYAQRMQAQADEYRRLQEQKMRNQQRAPVTSGLVPKPLVGGYNYTQMGQNQFTPQMNIRNYPGSQGGINMAGLQAQPDRWATTPQAMQQIQNYRQTPQPDRWATGSQANQYINNYLAYKKKQDDELRLLRQMAWQNGPAANFFFEGLGPPVPPPSTAQTPPPTDYGGYGDWGYPDYGGGGSTYTPKPPEWWVEMVQWRI